MKKHGRKKIRVGVIGLGRGAGFAAGAAAHGMELTALCDRWEDKMKLVCRAKDLSATLYTDYDKFLEHDMDAVILANNFHEHAPFAVKALEAGYHVMSETQACHTLAEGADLARAVEKSGRIYMFAENYPYSAANQEMRRLYRAGFVGDFRYGEGEYLHTMDAWTSNWLSPGFDHWRNWIPATYYCTHAMAPIMFITETRPVKVSGFIFPYDKADPQMVMNAKRNDPYSVIMATMDNGALVKLQQYHVRGRSRVRVHGTRGAVERDPFTGALHLFQHGFDSPKGKSVNKTYTPEFPARLRERAKKTGHGGGDFFMDYYFARAIRRGEQPFLDVYRGIDMSLVGIQAFRSALADNAAVEVPDFRKEAVRKRYEKDDWSPDPARRKKGQPWPSVLGNIKPSAKARKFARQVWAECEKQWQLKPWRRLDVNGRTIERFPANHILKALSGKHTARRRR